MSWESSAHYYRLINEAVKERKGGLHSARCILASVDFADVEPLQRAGRWKDAGALLNRAALGLERAGADLLVLCANTMHKVADEMMSGVLGAPRLSRQMAAECSTPGGIGTAITSQRAVDLPLGCRGAQRPEASGRRSRR